MAEDPGSGLEQFYQTVKSNHKIIINLAQYLLRLTLISISSVCTEHHHSSEAATESRLRIQEPGPPSGLIVSWHGSVAPIVTPRLDKVAGDGVVQSAMWPHHPPLLASVWLRSPGAHSEIPSPGPRRLFSCYCKQHTQDIICHGTRGHRL